MSRESSSAGPREATVALQLVDLQHHGSDPNGVRVISEFRTPRGRVEADHLELISGAGVYAAPSRHGPFVHIDTRGYRARWVSTAGE